MLSTIGLNDRLVISARQYTISKIQTNFKTMESKLELVTVEQGDLELFQENCVTYSNNQTDARSIVYMNTSGEIDHVSITAGASQQICMIGFPFRSELPLLTGSGGGSAQLIASTTIPNTSVVFNFAGGVRSGLNDGDTFSCLLYTSPSPRDRQKSRMPSSA